MKQYEPQTDTTGLPIKTYNVKHITSNIDLYEAEIKIKIGEDYLGATVYNDNEYTFHFNTESASIHFSRKILY
jgi:hypothetical protein